MGLRESVSCGSGQEHLPHLWLRSRRAVECPGVRGTSQSGATVVGLLRRAAGTPADPVFDGLVAAEFDALRLRVAELHAEIVRLTELCERLQRVPSSQYVPGPDVGPELDSPLAWEEP